MGVPNKNEAGIKCFQGWIHARFDSVLIRWQCTNKIEHTHDWCVLSPSNVALVGNAKSPGKFKRWKFTLFVSVIKLHTSFLFRHGQDSRII